MDSLGFDVSPQRLARQLMNNLDDDSMDMALPPRPAAAMAEDSVVSGVSFQSSTSKLSSMSDDAPAVSRTVTAGRTSKTKSIEDDFKTAQLEAPTPRQKQSSSIKVQTSSPGLNTILPARRFNSIASDQITVRSAPSDASSSDIGLPARPGEDSYVETDVETTTRTATSLGSPGVARGGNQATLASVLARNETRSDASASTQGDQQEVSKVTERPRDAGMNNAAVDLSFSSELPTPPVARAPISSTPKAVKTASSTMNDSSIANSMTQRNKSATSQDATERTASRFTSAPPSSRQSGEGSRGFLSATDFGQGGQMQSNQRSLANLSISTIASDDGKEVGRMLNVANPREPKPNVDESDSHSSEIKRGESAIKGIGSRSPLDEISINSRSSDRANRSNDPKKDAMSKYVFDSLRQRESLESGQRRRLASGEHSGSVSRQSTPQGSKKGSEEHSTSNQSGSSSFLGPRMDRLGRPNTFKAGFTPVVRRVSPLVSNLQESERRSEAGAPSEASSNDLMQPVHGGLRANTSFPGIGAGEEAPPSGARVEDDMLKEYLHKMNNQLSVENQEMKANMDKLQKQLNSALREKENLEERIAQGSPQAGKESGPSPESERLQTEIERLESIVTDQKEEIGDLEQDRQDLEKQLEDMQARLQQLENRTRSDRDDADGTMTQDLYDDIDDLHDENAKLQAELDKAQEALENVQQQLQDEQRLHEESIEKLKAHVTAQVETAEQEAAAAREEKVSLEAEIRRLRNEASGSRRASVSEVSTVRSENSDGHHCAGMLNLEDALAKLYAELQDLSRQLEQNDHDLAQRQEVIEVLEAENERMKQDIETIRNERDKLEEELQSADQGTNQFDEEKDDLLARISELESEVERLQTEIDGQENEASVSSEHKADGRADNTQILRRALEEAKSEIDRLKANKGSDVQRDAMLKEKENSLLKERISDLDSRVKSLQQHSFIAEKSMAAITSVVGHRSSVRTPKSPPALSSMSWLNHDSTLGGGSIIRQLHAVQQELDARNAEVDEKMDRLEVHRHTCMKLHEALAGAEAERDKLRDELDRLWAENGPIERARRSLKHIRCTGCSSTIDAAYRLTQVRRVGGSESELATSMANRSVSMAYDSVESKLRDIESKWAQERRSWLAERDDLNRENEQLRAEAHARQERELAENIDEARKATVELDEQARKERRRISGLAQISQECSRERATVEAKLGQTERELQAVREELSHKAREIERLGDELVHASSSGTHSSKYIDLLKKEQAMAAEEEKRLMSERDLILDERGKLFADYQRSQDRYRQIAEDLAASEQTVKSYQAQIETHRQTIETMVARLRSKDAEIQEIAGHRDRLRALRENVLKDVGDLDNRLTRTKNQLAKTSDELRQVHEQRKIERDHFEGQKQWFEAVKNDAEMALQRKTRALAVTEDKLARLEAELQNHVCDSAAVDDLRMQHVRECKGLLVQIRYLKTKFMRESDLRADMIHQKSYLCKIVGGLERNEEATRKFIADIGLSRNIPPAPKTALSRFRQAAVAVKAITRMKIMRANWEETLSVRQALQDARQVAKTRSA